MPHLSTLEPGRGAKILHNMPQAVDTVDCVWVYGAWQSEFPRPWSSFAKGTPQTSAGCSTKCSLKAAEQP